MKIISRKITHIPEYLKDTIDSKEEIPFLEQVRVKEYSKRTPLELGERRAIIPWSGGLDSTTSLLMALESGIKVITVNINYGQDYFEKEKSASERIRLLISDENDNWLEHYILDISWLAKYTLERFGGEWAHIFPLRNYLILEEASRLDSVKKYDEIWFSAVQGEIPFSGGDKSSVFINYINKVFGQKDLQLVTPLVGLSKSDLLWWASQKVERLNVIINTVSCFSGVGSTHCGKCQSCFNRAVAFYNVGMVDKCGFEISRSDLGTFADSYTLKLDRESYYSKSRREQIGKFINFLKETA